jgi:hypothetical protein
MITCSVDTDRNDFSVFNMEYLPIYYEMIFPENDSWHI